MVRLGRLAQFLTASLLPPDVVTVSRLYAVLAPVHDLLAQRVAVRARRLALAWLSVRDGERVVELAPGTGLAFVRLVQANPSGHTLGIDRAPAMLRRARRRLRGVPLVWTLRVGDARQVSAPAGSVDALYAGYLLDQFARDDRRRILMEIRRLLRPGGRLVLQHMTRPQSAAARTWGALAHRVPWLLGRSQPLCVRPDLHACGFTGLRRTYVEEAGFPSEVVYAERTYSSPSHARPIRP